MKYKDLVYPAIYKRFEYDPITKDELYLVTGISEMGFSEDDIDESGEEEFYIVARPLDSERVSYIPYNFFFSKVNKKKYPDTKQRLMFELYNPDPNYKVMEIGSEKLPIIVTALDIALDIIMNELSECKIHYYSRLSRVIDSEYGNHHSSCRDMYSKMRAMYEAITIYQSKK
ncbi:MAG: hypothetical protein RR420_00870 [Anaerovoracaceae bacterium]